MTYSPGPLPGDLTPFHTESLVDGTAGNAYQLTPAPPLAYFIHGIAFRLTTDANAANRRIIIYGRGLLTTHIPSTYVVTALDHVASTTVDYSFGTSNINDAGGTTFFAPQITYSTNLQSPIYTALGNLLFISVWNMQAGDVLTKIAIKYQQWLSR